LKEPPPPISYEVGLAPEPTNDVGKGEAKIPHAIAIVNERRPATKDGVSPLSHDVVTGGDFSSASMFSLGRT
jgi:hypothetical protein